MLHANVQISGLNTGIVRRLDNMMIYADDIRLIRRSVMSPVNPAANIQSSVLVKNISVTAE